MDDAALLARISELVEEENALHHQEEHGELADPHNERMRALQISLDQCWDLLRQRRARRAAGEDPDKAHVRPPEIVENYRQ